MFSLYKKIRDSWIYSILFGCFLLAIFLLFFYLANLDLKPVPKTASVNEASLTISAGDELVQKLGSTEMSFTGYTEWAKLSHLDDTNNKLDDDPDGDGLPNYLEYVYGTDPLNSDTDGDKFSDRQEITNGYDPDASGDIKPTVEIEIDKIGVRAPMVWSQSDDENAMLKDLENGVIHYPKSAAPGQTGNMIVSGHSSNYVWAAGNYNHIFKDLGNVEAGDMVIIRTVQQNGRIITFHYRVQSKVVVTPDDPQIFADSSQPTLTLSTCWPIGTALKRLIIKADLVQ